MGFLRIAEFCSKYAKINGKNITRIIETKPVAKMEMQGLKYVPVFEDTVKFSECLRKPTAEKLELMLKEQGISDKLFLVEESFIKENNSLFLEELIKRFPLKVGEKENKRVRELMIYLEDINHAGQPNKKAFLEQFLKDVKEVESMVDREGNQMFSGSADWAIMTRRAILQAKYNNPERYQEIMDLYKLHMLGKTPKYVLRALFPESKFHHLPKSDMEKLLKGENYYPKLKELSDVAISKLEVGEAFSIGKNMFVKTANGYEKLKMDVQMYEKLFPAIERYTLAQGEINNCHLVSAMDAIIKNPEGRIEFYKLFEQVGENKVKCSINLYKNRGEVFDLADLSKLDTISYKNGSLGQKMAEYTYCKNIYDDLLHDPKCSEFVRDFQLERIGGDPYKIFDLPADVVDVSEHIENLIGFKTQYQTTFTKDLILNILKEQKGISVSDCSTRIPKKGLYDGHFYNSDLTKGTLINPWNTMEEIYYSPFELQRGVIYVV